ncbi:MAG: hypothetical protein IT353_02810 [Gemmatimonadaceae bacterium]|nr:hypothetical protein [Gemmatimonadaceae bacterium]
MTAALLSRPQLRTLPAEIVVEPNHPWGHTWFTLLQSRWTSLALVPAEPGESTVFAAKALADVGRLYQFEPIQVINAGDVASGNLQGVLGTIEQFNGSPARLLVSVSSPLTHDAAIPAARAADAAVLVVTMGQSSLETARRTIDCIGASHFIGAVVLKP